jgi:hypothetical protein
MESGEWVEEAWASSFGVQGARQRVAMERADGVHARRPRRHIIEHEVRIEVGRVGVSSGWLHAKLATGPKTKFSHLNPLYIFY